MALYCWRRRGVLSGLTRRRQPILDLIPHATGFSTLEIWCVIPVLRLILQLPILVVMW